MDDLLYRKLRWDYDHAITSDVQNSKIQTIQGLAFCNHRVEYRNVDVLVGLFR